MNGFLSTSAVQSLESVSISALKSYVSDQGYVYREQWGTHLSRFSKKIGAREIDVFIPTSPTIRDFKRRINDLVETLSAQSKVSRDRILRDLVNSGYDIVRIAANEGEHEATLGFDAAIDLLQGGYALIDSCAVVAASTTLIAAIRGRRTDAVRNYLDKIRVGQTEVGSFVLTLLMPSDFDSVEVPNLENIAGTFGSRVVDRLSVALSTADLATKAIGDSSHGFAQGGLTANFSGAMHRMLASAGDIIITLDNSLISTKPKRAKRFKFRSESADRFKEIEQYLKPVELKGRHTLAGEILNIKEPKGKKSGFFVMACDVDGEDRSVRVKYNRSQRVFLMNAMNNKGVSLLSVSGNLVSKNGKLNLEDPNEFQVAGIDTLL